jgi:hypothetical protein
MGYWYRSIFKTDAINGTDILLSLDEWASGIVVAIPVIHNIT